MWGGVGNDVFYGGGGTDTLKGEDGDDSIYGQDGDDYLIGGYGADVFGGGNGYDTLDYSARGDGGVVISIGGYSGNANDSFADLVSSDIERVQGTNYNDVIFGSANDDFILGYGGDDEIYCNGGTDIVFAGGGNDTIDADGDPGSVDQIYGENRDWLSSQVNPLEGRPPRQLAALSAAVVTLICKGVRKTAWFLILFQVLFLNLFVPGHTRGAITLAENCDGKVASCCEMKKTKDPKHVPTPEERRCCAVCYLASTYVPIDPIVVFFDFRELIRQSHELAVAQVRSLDYPAPFWPVGPPSLAA